MGEYAPAVTIAFRVDGQNDALISKFTGSFQNKVRIVDRGGIQAYFVCTRMKHLGNVVEVTQATANSEWHKALGRRLLDDVVHYLAFVTRCSDIQKHELVGALFIVCFGARYGITGITEFLELYSFDYPPRVDVQAWNDSFCQHVRMATIRATSK